MTLFLLVIHVKRTSYFENPSKEVTQNIYSGQSIISTHMTSSDNKYIFNCSFYNIRSGIVIKNFDIDLIKFDKGKNSTLNLEKILPYSGMHPWDIPQFKNFAIIPDSLKVLNSSNNPYFAYDYVFEDDRKNYGDKFIVKISADFTENYIEKHLIKELLIIRKSKLEVVPLDAHSDGSYLLIPIIGLITVILFVVKIFVRVRRRQAQQKAQF